jgi:Cohesin domain/Putative Ig domain/FlgD Ig-like domain
MKRKCLGILLAFSLLIVHITAQAGSLPISVTLPSLSIDPSQIGQTINVPLTISDITGLEVTGFNFKLTYNRSVVEYVGYDKAGTLSSVLTGFYPFNDTTNSLVCFAVAGTAAMSGQGVLINLQFKILALGSSSLIFQDENGNTLIKINDVISPIINTGRIKVGNHKPTMTAILPITAAERDTVRFTAVGTDPDVDSLAYTMTGAPLGATLNTKTGKFQWLPPYGAKGSYTIAVTCTDPGGLSDATNASITISKKNVKPYLAAVTPKSVTERDTLKFTITAIDSNGDAITYDLKPLPSSALFSSTTGTFTWAPDTGSSGVLQMTAVAKDVDNAADTVKFTITVIKKDFTPAIQKITAKSVIEADTLKFTVSGADGYGEKIKYSASSLPTGAKLDSVTGSFIWVPAIGAAGKYSILFKASDPGGLFDTTTAVVTVVMKNVKPTFAVIPATAKNELDTVKIIVTATDPNTGDVLTYTAISTPLGSSFTAATRTFLWVPALNTAGVYTVKFIVSDGLLTDTANAVITISKTNLKPVFVSRIPVNQDSVQLNYSFKLNYKVAAIDPNRDSLTYMWKLNNVVAKTGRDSTYAPQGVFTTLGTQRIVCVFSDGSLSDSTVWTFTVVTKSTGVNSMASGVPTEFSLNQNYPNPFNPSTTISFGLPMAAPVTLEIYSILGAKVRTLVSGSMMSAAYHSIVWDGKNDAGSQVTSGMYLYRIVADNHVSTMKMLLMK